MHTSTARGRRRRLTPLSALLASALAIAACSGGGAGAGPAAPATGGTLTYRLGNDDGCIDPQQVRLRTMLGVGRQFADSLTFQAQDGTIAPWLAESWEANADASEFTFLLREGVTFSDGTPFDASTVVANLDAVKRMGAAAAVAGPYLAAYTGAEATGPRTVVVRFSRPSAQFLQAVSTPSLAMLSPQTLGAPLAERCTGSLVGTGPFTVADYRSNDGIDLVRRDGYAWAPAPFANQGAAHLDGVAFRFVPDATVAAGMLAAQQVDVAAELNPIDAATFDPSITLNDRPSAGFANSFFLNLQRPVLRDAAVRQAFLGALDRTALVATLGSPIMQPATDVLSRSTPAYVDHSAMLAQDQAESRRLLDAAGWIPGPDGIRTRDGARLELGVNYMMPVAAAYVPLLELAQRQLADVGIAIRLNPLSAVEDNQARVDGDYDARFNGLSRADADVLTSVLTGADPTVDGLLVRQAGLLGAERDAVVGELTGYALQNAYVIPVLDQVLPIGYGPTVAGIDFDATNTPSLHGVSLSGGE